MGLFFRGGSFAWDLLVNVVLTLVIHSGMCSPWMHLFISSIACREWMWTSWKRNHVFLHSLAFSSLIFFSVILSKLMRISAFGPSSSPSSFLVYLFSIFVMFFWMQYFSPKLTFFLFCFFWHPIFCMFSCHFLPVVDRIFFGFLNVLFCLFCFNLVNISLITFFRQYFLVYFLK